MNFNLLEKKLLALFLHKKEVIMFKICIFISCLFIASSFASLRTDAEKRLENVEDESQKFLLNAILYLNDRINNLNEKAFDLQEVLEAHSHFYDIPETEQDLTLQRRTSSAEIPQSIEGDKAKKDRTVRRSTRRAIR